MHPLVQSRKANGRHAYELFVDGEPVAQLEWRQDEQRRRDAGWWLVNRAGSRPPRRLHVDRAIDDLAADARRPAAEWADDADSLALLTADLALLRAERLLAGRIAMREERDALPAGAYEIVVDGVDVVELAMALPHVAVHRLDDVLVVSGDFDAASIRAALDRLGQIGARIVAVTWDR